MPTSSGPEATIYLALGSNEGDRRAHLREGVRQLQRCAKVERLSSVYETAPAYVTDQPPYLNMALRARTRLQPRALLGCLKQIEREIGRTAGVRWGPRAI